MTIHTYKTPWRMHVKDSIENSVMVLTEVILYTNIVDSPTQLTCFVHSDVYICHNTKVGNRRKKSRMGNFLTQVWPRTPSRRGRRIYKK